MSSLTNITIVSWPPLWIYWPLYMALVKTHHLFKSKNRNIVFRFEIPEPVTDQIIRERFYRNIKIGGDHLVMALCEPGDTKPGANPSEPGMNVRKMPLLWRLPHWVITHRDSLPELKDFYSHRVKSIDLPLKDLPNPVTIYCFPQDTTSGDYVRTIRQSLPALRDKDVTFKDILPGRDRLATLNLEEGAYQISFTPWHQVDSERYVAISELPGPHFDITALLIPAEWSTDQQVMANIYNAILLQLNHILISLADTQGDRGEIERYIKGSFKEVLDLFPSHHLPPPSNLAEFLSIYIKRGCYFPYLVFEKALQSELSLMIRNQLNRASKIAAEGIQHEMSLLLGSRIDWSDLSFKERIEIQTTWHQAYRTSDDLLSEQFSREMLYEKLLHPDKDEQDNGYTNFLSSIKVQTSNDANPLALIRLNNRDRLLICSSQGDDGRMPYEDCRNATLGYDTAGEVYEKSPCFTCTVGGVAGSLVVAGATRLIGPILKRVASAKAEGGNDAGAQTAGLPLIKVQAVRVDQDGSHPAIGTILCWQDIQEVFSIFCSELREPDINPYPCYILLASDWHWQAEGHILLGILWRGSTKEGMTGAGRATRKLEDWASSQNQAERPVSWCGFWNKDPEETWTKVFPKLLAEGKAESSPALPAHLKIWLPFREAIAEGNYNFAYLAVFDCPAVES